MGAAGADSLLSVQISTQDNDDSIFSSSESMEVQWNHGNSRIDEEEEENDEPKRLSANCL